MAEKDFQGAAGIMLKGVVKWFDETKGYGYIEDGNGEQIFVHFTDIIQQRGFRTLNKGDRVQFEVIQGELGAKATNVIKL